MFRSDLASFAATQKVKIQNQGKAEFTSEEYTAMDDLKIKDGFIQKIVDMIETKYLRFCDPSDPLQLMTLFGGRTATNLVRFLAHHPRRWANLDQVPAAEQQLVWSIALQLLEQYNTMQSNPQLRRFAWNIPYFIQWHAVIHVLDTLRAHPLHPDAVKTWRLIDALYENNSGVLLNTSKPIFVAVGNLCMKAFSARAAVLMKEKRSLFDPPDYIAMLREQREAAKARREAVMRRREEQQALDSGKRLGITEVQAEWPGTGPRSAGALVEAQLQQHFVANKPANPTHGSTRAGDDAFWLSDALDDGFFAGGGADMMSIYTDTILAHDYSLDTPSGEAIDWGQWDAWIGAPVLSNKDAGSRV